jgi:hypothetical protein
MASRAPPDERDTGKEGRPSPAPVFGNVPDEAREAQMPRSLPLVVSPLRNVLEQNGVALMLVSIEVSQDEVVVRARGLPSERTAALENDFDEALERWHREGADKEALPLQPFDRIFNVDVSLADDVGTAYSPIHSARGGSGRMFRAEWFFAPGPPAAAQSLIVRIDGAETSIEIDANR